MVARTLAQRGVEAIVFLLGSVAEVKNDARINLEVLGRIGMTVIEITNAQEWELHFTEVSECDVIVDALVGTGFRGRLTGLFETVVADVNDLGLRSSRSICRADSRPTPPSCRAPPSKRR